MAEQEKEEKQKELDLHTETAARIFGVKYEDVTPAQRRLAKVANYGQLYTPKGKHEN